MKSKYESKNLSIKLEKKSRHEPSTRIKKKNIHIKYEIQKNNTVVKYESQKYFYSYRG